MGIVVISNIVAHLTKGNKITRMVSIVNRFKLRELHNMVCFKSPTYSAIWDHTLMPIPSIDDFSSRFPFSTIRMPMRATDVIPIGEVGVIDTSHMTGAGTKTASPFLGRLNTEGSFTGFANCLRACSQSFTATIYRTINSGCTLSFKWFLAPLARLNDGNGFLHSMSFTLKRFLRRPCSKLGVTYNATPNVFPFSTFLVSNRSGDASGTGNTEKCFHPFEIINGDKSGFLASRTRDLLPLSFPSHISIIPHNVNSVKGGYMNESL